MLPLVLFSCAHFFIDLYSIALGVLQPLLLAQFGLSLTQAGLIGGVLVAAGFAGVLLALLQPK